MWNTSNNTEGILTCGTLAITQKGFLPVGL